VQTFQVSNLEEKKEKKKEERSIPYKQTNKQDISLSFFCVDKINQTAVQKHQTF